MRCLWLLLKHRTEFLRSLGIFFKNQPVILLNFYKYPVANCVTNIISALQKTICLCRSLTNTLKSSNKSIQDLLKFSIYSVFSPGCTINRIHISWSDKIIKSRPRSKMIGFWIKTVKQLEYWYTFFKNQAEMCCTMGCFCTHPAQSFTTDKYMVRKFMKHKTSPLFNNYFVILFLRYLNVFTC